MTEAAVTSIEVAPGELCESLSAMRLCERMAVQRMQLSLTTLGQLTPVQTYRVEERLEVFDGLKRLRAVRQLSWPRLRVEVHALDSAGAKVRLLRCNAAAGLSELEEGWLVRSLYRDDRLQQPQIAMLLGRHKSWVCRRLALAEDLSESLTASVRLGLVSATAAAELSRLQRCNQDAAAQIVAQRGLTTRHTARLVEALLGAPAESWPKLLEEAARAFALTLPRGGVPRRTPGEQLVADTWGMKRLSARLNARLLERSLESLGPASCANVSRELLELRSTLLALTHTLDRRLAAPGATHALA